jgi:hypothetical protein
VQWIGSAQPARQAILRGARRLRCLVTIRKSDVVDFEWLAVISNCTRCRLEIVGAVHGKPAQQAILRKRSRLEIGAEVAGRRSPEGMGARRGDVLGVRRPAALGIRPERRM